MSPDSGSTAPPGAGRCRSSVMRSARPWPLGTASPTRITHWRTAKVHPDHHVACQYALYSVPSSLCPPGQRVEIGLGSKLVRIYHRGRLLKLHPRQPRGGRSTDAADYPAELTPYTLRAPDRMKRAGRSTARRWPTSPTGSLTVHFHGPRSDRATSSSAWDSATRRSVWTPSAAGPWTWTSSTCAGSNASWCRALERSEATEHPPPLPAGRFARPGSVFAHAKGGQS